MHRFHHPLLALVFSLVLLGGQQAALAHVFAHLTQGAAAGVAVQVAQQEDADHGAVHVHSQLCTTCLALAGVDAVSPVSIFTLPLLAESAATLVVAVPPAPTFDQPLAFLSRAPPSLRS